MHVSPELHVAPEQHGSCDAPQCPVDALHMPLEHTRPALHAVPPQHASPLEPHIAVVTV